MTRQTRRRSIVFLCLMLATLSASATQPDGLIRHESPYSASQTVDRFVDLARNKGLHIFNTVDHAAGAERVDMTLRPTQVVIFGNPKGGTPLMQCAQTLGIDLPLKALVWTDAHGQTWLGYNDPAYLAARHGAPDCPAVKPISNALAKLAQATIAEKTDS